MRLRIILELRTAELLNDYPYSRQQEAMKCCQEALRFIELFSKEDKYLKNKALSIMAEVMSNDNIYDMDHVEKTFEIHFRSQNRPAIPLR